MTLEPGGESANPKTSLLRQCDAFGTHGMFAVWQTLGDFHVRLVFGCKEQSGSDQGSVPPHYKKEKQKMQAEMKAQDAELATTVATMNSAAPDKKPIWWPASSLNWLSSVRPCMCKAQRWKRR
jgi:hypothetical protein